MKKRIISVFISVFLMLSMINVSFASYFPGEEISAENIEMEICNLSNIGTVTEKDAAFKLIFDYKKATKIEVEYGIDNGVAEKRTINIVPGKTEKIFDIKVTNGIHTLKIFVYQNDIQVKTFTETIYVTDLYEKQFMDELSIRGIGINFSSTMSDELFLNFLKNSGWKVVRGAQTLWHELEKSKGLYDFKGMQNKIQFANSADMRMYSLLYNGNGFLYPAQPGIDSWKHDNKTIAAYIPQTKESLEGFANYNEAHTGFVNQYDSISTWEIWNEPDLVKQAPSIFGRSQAYVDVVKAAIIRNLYNGDDKNYALFTATYDADFFDYGYEAGLYPYAGGISHHIYTSSGANFGFEIDRLYENRLNALENVIIENGGWKDKSMSETGYTTPEAAKYPTPDEAGKDIAKVYAECELNDYADCLVYCMIDTGTDKSYTEHNFGQITYDHKPKQSYIATVAFNNLTQGGIITGELDFGDDLATRAIVYYKDGEPVVMAWTDSEDGRFVDWAPEGQTFDVYNYYGSKIEENATKVTLSTAPVYLKGFSKDWIAKAVKFEVEQRGNDWLARYGETANSSVKAQFEKEIRSIEENLNTVPSSNELEEHMNKLSDIALEIIEGGKTGEYSEINVSRMVYGIFRVMQRVNNLYIVAYDGEVSSKNSHDSAEAQKKADKLYAKDMRIMQYSDEILRHAKKYATNIDKVIEMESNPSKAGIIAGWSYMEEVLCEWFDVFSDYESLTELGYQIQSSYFDRNAYVNADITTPYRVWNYSRRDFTGTLNIYDDEGNLVAKSGHFTINGNGGYIEQNMTINTKRPGDGKGQGFYDVCLVDLKGNIISTQKTVYEVADKFLVESEPCTENIQEVSSLSIKIKNVMNEPAKAYLTVESDENFKFVKTKYEVNIEGNSSTFVEMPITEIKETAYHMYTFKYSVEDENGNVIVIGENPVNFTTIVKTEKDIDVKNFDGDISDWQDAYPIYLNAPLNPNSAEEWKNAQCSSRVMLKWNEGVIYILGDIYDNFHLQEYQGEKIWQGDSMQFSFDPLNDGTMIINGGLQTSYRPDDYELGFAFTANGNEYYSWQSPNGLTGGTVEWLKIVRDNERKNTRYLVKIDTSIMEGISFAEGNSIGINLVVNDADILDRDNFYEFAAGTASRKDPSQYADFILSSVKPKDMIDGKATEIFPTTIKNAF